MLKHVSILALLAIGLTNCHSPENQTAVAPTTTETLLEADRARIEFSKTLAKALVDKDLRDFLRKEALKQFDNDYDVFFHALKGKKVKEGVTFSDLLATYHSSRQEFESVVNSLPKLTILVPDFIVTSAKRWDTEKLIPQVAVATTELEQKRVNYIQVYNAEGQESRIDPVKFPDNLVLVVKDNERIGVAGSGGRTTIDPTWDFYFTDQSNQYYFTSTHFNRAKAAPARSGTVANTNRVQSTAGVQTIPNCPREDVYYSNEDFNNNVLERLAYFRFTSYDKVGFISENFTEGNLEIRAQVLLGGQSSGAFSNYNFGTLSIPKTAALLSIPGYMDRVEREYGAGWREIFQGVLNEHIAQGIMVESPSSTLSGPWLVWGADVISWSPHRYGDEIKYIFKEHDEGETVKEVKTFETGFNASYGKKDVWNIGFTGKVTGSTEISYTNTSDDCGEQAVYYCSSFGLNAPYRSTGDIDYAFEVR
ncbi:hypothetical protein [Spirosoma validum]|uniref:Uncharacterized protein n=1 Tax=Spirosoma validum TaxID=2771355 RepID=A0A927GGK8_9BACT|nr:hypothetical protein [Spirosoma validum]MBD2756986.1 hypothetical protein [Spirosoma validum]